MAISKSSKVKQSIATNIQNYLDNNKLTMTGFGRLVGVTRSAVKFWLEGRNIPDIDLFPAICDLLNITIYEFIGVEDPNKLTETEFEIIESYHNNENFRILIDRYRSDSKFRNDIDKLMNQ
ncbi:MAG: helix-turn-helix transcriptional regulator [Bacilli bacterium]|nr:helix-turn-helix transcriptional regulator [Bacilli bacterium]